jgi:hypothetical protein
VYSVSRYATINHIRDKLTTYHSRLGLEIIPFPGKVSFYGNVNFIMGASGTKEFLTRLSIPESTDPRPILERAEYFDIGIRYQFRWDILIITPDMNLILAERRIVSKSNQGDWVIPSMSIDVACLLNHKKYYKTEE